MRRVFVFKFGGTASQLVISGGRHGVHLAERHAGRARLLCARRPVYPKATWFRHFGCRILTSCFKSFRLDFDVYLIEKFR